MSREFKTPKGTILPLMDIKGKPYLSIQHRIVWFREEHPDWTIRAYFITHLCSKDETFFQCEISNVEGRVLATGHKREDKAGFADHYEKAESGAIGRALGFLGYGTAFALDLEEGQRLADAPANETEKKSQIIKPVQSQEIRGEKSSRESTASDPKIDSMNHVNQEPGDYVITFGKHKDKTVKELVDAIGMFQVASYVGWLEKDASVKKKPLGQSAQDFKEAFDAFVGTSELDRALSPPVRDKSVHDQLERLKNQFPGVPGAPMPKAYKDSDDEIPWPENE